jgi:general secretion pathway protein E
MGVQHFLIQASLAGVMAQRLVRRVCDNCRETFEIEAREMEAMGIQTGKAGPIRLYQGKGCTKCRYTGYRGRIGVFELMPYTDALRKATTLRTDLHKIRQISRDEGMHTLREDAIRKMLNGDTTYQEVLRVTWDH